jgi:TetR/AcrR family fatty acid metabolism transcriptional regulator
MSIHSVVLVMEINMASSRKAVPAKVLDKRTAILRAATKVFARNGYFNSKVADIAREAGVADGTVYLYFKNKDDVLISLVNQTMDEFIAIGRAQIEKLQDPRDKLRALARLHLKGLGRDRDLAIVFQVELRQSTKFMEEFSATKMAEYFSVMREAIEEGQRRGVFRKTLNPKVVSKILFGALDEMATNWILSNKRYDLGSFADTVMDVFFNGVLTRDGEGQKRGS